MKTKPPQAGYDRHSLKPYGTAPGVCAEGLTADGPAQQNRWLYLTGVAARLTELGREGGPDTVAVLDEIETNLLGLNDVFTRDIDPLSDMEGYAVRRLSLALLALIRRLRCAQDGRP